MSAVAPWRRPARDHFPGVPAWGRGLAGVARRFMVRRYMGVYRAAAPLQARNLPYYEAVRILSADSDGGTSAASKRIVMVGLKTGRP